VHLDVADHKGTRRFEGATAHDEASPILDASMMMGDWRG